MIEKINGKLFRDMFISGANNLQNNKELIDKLNVFPVPDGDTGTNMSLTIAAAIKELNKVESDNLSEIGKALSKGSLMGARGNSGVILSQIIRGISKSVEGKNELGIDEFAKALKSGSDTAYKAVIKPIEGTILTVVRESGEFAVKNVKKNKSFIEFFEKVLIEANKSLEKTPELLKNLKDAGVVDSGGKGLVCLYEGMLSALKGKIVDLQESDKIDSVQSIANDYVETQGELDIKFGYCTEFILESENADPEKIRDIMLKYGDSLVVVGYDGVIKVHVHSNEPGNVLQEALKFGQLLTIKIENMRYQHENLIIPDDDQESNSKLASQDKVIVNEESKPFGFITTTMGKGLAGIFEEFGVDIVIEGGQTMNPSTEDFINAINMVNADNIFILPNNGNVIMAANQAKEISEKNIYVVPTKNIPQGIGCLVSFDPDSDADSNMENFDEVLSNIKSGEITFAVRDTIMDGIEVNEGDVIGITGKSLISSGKDIAEVTKEVVRNMADEDSDIITLYYGEDVEEDDARLLAETIQEEYEDVDVELYYGGQPLYYYLISVE
ncbi:DAK2 domain-containing protein [Peptostreptococcus anaerobius]|uniref:DAK2 domain-containing protein n=1 Tax=Peptostreptococcus porci TaxID=2652282 RepID=A0A6N7XIA1_9FIRM|nr:DAK2 domain-containing protein [Peptostreptococcus porci]MDD7183244.1 DAK2 domain-containing protein [Peptostreptococcus porci]MDY5964485.1 DAK2 domain-containing protein [Peptostreptococcus porci]MST63127.1 DAK2 domain-containing protein [Peptostreptococcus porci]